jgi:hypothetical protein
MRMRHVSLAMLVGALLLVACGADQDEQATGAPPAPPAPEPSPVTLWLSAERVPPGPAELVAVLVNRAGGEVMFGVGAEVDRWDGSTWVPHRKLGMCLEGWHCTAEMRPLDEELVIPSIGLTATLDRPGPLQRFTTDGLESGWYRISQMANEGMVASGIVEVALGAAAPAPIVPVDSPVISVTPPLLAPGGGTVTLFPLVPGATSIGDLERALEELAETASIERWSGDGWAPVAELDLELDPGGREPSFERSLDLPALEVGDYRIVRAHPGGDHVGRFWVVPADLLGR